MNETDDHALVAASDFHNIDDVVTIRELRAEVLTLRERIAFLESPEVSDDIAQHLRALVACNPDGHTGCVETWGRAADEIERLRLQLSATEDMAATLEADVLQLRARVAELEKVRLSYIGAYLEREADIERLNWLIAEGETHFGTLWKDATFADIDALRHPPMKNDGRP